MKQLKIQGTFAQSIIRGEIILKKTKNTRNRAKSLNIFKNAILKQYLIYIIYLFLIILI